jgi:hypothetical protein
MTVSFAPIGSIAACRDGPPAGAASLPGLRDEASANHDRLLITGLSRNDSQSLPVVDPTRLEFRGFVPGLPGRAVGFSAARLAQLLLTPHLANPAMPDPKEFRA